MDDAKKVLSLALELPQHERAQLAAQLLASLDAEDDDVEEAWAREIERRCRALDSGEEATVSWPDLRAEIERDILKK